jgi:hypothetical protein
MSEFNDWGIYLIELYVDIIFKSIFKILLFDLYLCLNVSLFECESRKNNINKIKTVSIN